MSDYILEVKNATMKFGELRAVDNLSFFVNRGEILGIAGPNGAGKTTLFNLITGVYHGEGSIVFNGMHIEKLSPDQVCKKGIGRTFQTPSVFKTMTVRENLVLGAYFGNPAERKQCEEYADYILEVVGLKDKANLVVEHCRLYDKKMTMLGAVLATKPELLFLDEPLGGLSPTEIVDSVNCFERINRDMNITLIVIEHIMKFLMALSERMMILQNGAKIAEGTPEEVAHDRKVIEVYLGEEFEHAEGE